MVKAACLESRISRARTPLWPSSFREIKLFFPVLSWRFNIVGRFRVRDLAYLTSDAQTSSNICSPRLLTFMHSFIHLFIHLLISSFIHSFIHSFIQISDGLSGFTLVLIFNVWYRKHFHIKNFIKYHVYYWCCVEQPGHAVLHVLDWNISHKH